MAAPIPAAALSRTSGRVPLSVYFDYSGTTDEDETAPFHTLFYMTSFADTDSESFTYGARTRSKNVAYGPQAAHVYKTAGTYRPSMLCLDGTNAVITVMGPITASDWPDDANTVCVGNVLPVNGENGVPDNATCVASSDFDATISTYLTGANKRVLFKRGDTFTASADSSSSATAAQVGAYGTGAKPIILPAAGVNVLSLSGTDVRVTDLDIDGDSEGTATGIAGGDGATQITTLGVDFHDMGAALVFSDFTDLFDQITVQESTIQRIVGGNGNNGGYIASSRFAWLGNLVDDTTQGEHGLRVPYGNKFVISCSTFSRAADGKTVQTTRAPDFSGTVIYPSGLYTEYGVISNNKFTPNSTQLGTVGAAPQNNTSDERLRNLIYEGNYWGIPDGANATVIHFAFTVSSITVRNNTFNTAPTAANNDQRLIDCQMTNTTMGYPAPDGVWIYNNSAGGTYSGTSFAMIALDTEVTNAVVKNNLAYIPSATSPALLRDNATGTTTGGNSTDEQVDTTDPQFIGPLTSIDGFKIAAASYATDGGTATGVPTSALNNDLFNGFELTTATYRMGAAGPASQFSYRSVP